MTFVPSKDSLQRSLSRLAILGMITCGSSPITTANEGPRGVGPVRLTLDAAGNRWERPLGPSNGTMELVYPDPVVQGSRINRPNEAVELPTVSPRRSTESLRAEMQQQRFPDGKIQIERYVTEDSDGNLILHGPFKEFNSTGTLIRSGTYEMGELQGNWSQVISVANLQQLHDSLDAGFRPPFKSEANFVDGQLHGDWTIVDSRGAPVLVWQFEQGRREHLSTWFNSRNLAIRSITYANGIPDGPASQMVAGRRDPQQLTFDKGRLVQAKTQWYQPGKKRAQESWLVPTAERSASHDWWNSTIQTEPLPITESVRHDAFAAWHPNGQPSVEGNFRYGQPEGEFRWWYANGQVQAEGVYTDGEPIGLWVWWHPNGMKMIEGSYSDGEQVGTWSQWGVDGALVLRDTPPNFPVVRQELEPAVQATAVPARTNRSAATRPVQRTTR